MSYDSERINLILQCALLLAGEQDEFTDRQLGPIHLIKYVYLADLAYAVRNSGQTYTGVAWQFYKFGPWSQPVYEHIEPALREIGAEKKTFKSDYEDKDDWVRWYLRDSDLLEGKEEALPLEIRLFLRRDVRRLGNDTPALLENVYRSEPMLAAAPYEQLDFAAVAQGGVSQSASMNGRLKVESVSARKHKKFKEGMKALQKERKNRKAVGPRLKDPVKKPRYDKVYEEGIRWLDSLAGEELPQGEIAAEFSDDVWKSLTRTSGEDVS